MLSSNITIESMVASSIHDTEKTINDYLQYGVQGIVDEKIILTALFKTSDKPQKILDYLMKLNAADNNIGLMFAQSQNNLDICKQYLIFLKKLHDSGISITDICLLMMQKAANGQSFGDIIISRGIPELQDDYLTFLRYLLIQGAASAQIINLIPCFALANDKTCQDYLDFFKELYLAHKIQIGTLCEFFTAINCILQNRNDATVTRYLSILNELTNVKENAQPIFRLILHQFQPDMNKPLSAKNCVQYFTLLKQLHKQGIDLKEIESLLFNKPFYQHTNRLGKSYASAIEYCELLNYFLDHGMSVENVAQQISIQNGEAMACDEKSATVYIDLIKRLYEGSHYTTLDIQNFGTIFYRLTDYKHIAATQNFLSCLITAVEHNKEPKIIKSILTTSISVHIEYMNDAKTTLSYLYLLIALYKAGYNRGVTKNYIDHMARSVNEQKYYADKKSLKDYYAHDPLLRITLRQCADPKKLYPLLCESKLFHSMSIYYLPSKTKRSVFGYYDENEYVYSNSLSLAENYCSKEKIFAYINTFPLEKKREALTNALTEGHPLYNFFNVQRGCFKPRKDKGMFAVIKEKLDEIESNNKLNLTTTSIHNHLSSLWQSSLTKEKAAMEPVHIYENKPAQP